MAGNAAEPVGGGLLFKLRVFASVGFGSGLAPVAPGTFGTVGAMICFLPFATLAAEQPVLYGVTLVGLIFVAVWCSDAGEAHYKRHDVGNIVIDEFAGFFVTMFLVPTNVRTLALAFMLFRFFDIVKVPPARQIDKGWPGGWGVVMDDVVSGVYACAVMQIALRVAPAALGL